MKNRENQPRRAFLKYAGMGVTAVASIGAGNQTSLSQTSSDHAENGSSGIFNVRQYGAKGDGSTIDTRAINDTIAAAAVAGGGKVLFPAGTYASYSIRSEEPT